MSHSTPQRPSGSKQLSGDRLTHVPHSKQDKLKQMVARELTDATWELDPATLARVLSSKTRKVGAPALTIDAVDVLENYDIEIDKREPLLKDAVEALKYKDLLACQANSEKLHYQLLVNFLNSCVEAGLSIYDKSTYYRLLRFIVFDRPTQDKVLGSSPLKPDIAGANELSPDETQLMWRPPSGKRLSTMEIPVEVKGKSWAELIRHAATYGRALNSARPLRQFSLVLAYNHVLHELRFLVFHAGGLTASHALNLNKPKHRTDILRLFLSLLTWKTPGDAGLPEWTNDTEMFVQESEDDQKGLRMSVEEVLYERLGVRGRRVHVSRVRPISGQSTSSTPVVTAATGRRSARIAEIAHKELPSGSRGRGSAHRKSNKRSSRTARIPEQGQGQPNKISDTCGTGITPFTIPQAIDHIHRKLLDFSREISQSTTGVISKCSWVGKSYVLVESKMLKECSGMFGVATHYHSSIVYHKNGLPATNHLFLEKAKFWDPFLVSKNTGGPDFRSLVQHFSQFAGQSLVTVTSPGMLFVAIVHAALGYRNLMERGYQHRDISIGNVLWLDPPRKTNSVFETFQGDPSYLDTPRVRLEAQLKQSGVNELCRGFVIDGDMAVELKSYFTEDRQGSRSGTDEFMSDNMLQATRLHKPYLQSPVDDLWSFYYVAQWAAVFNDTNFSDTPIPDELAELRQSITGPYEKRDSGTRTIARPDLEPTSYGQFLADCFPFLRDWQSKLYQLSKDWKEAEGDESTIHDSFYDFTDRGVLDLLQLVQEHFSNNLSGQSDQ